MKHFDTISRKFHGGWANNARRHHALHQACLVVALSMDGSELASHRDRARELRGYAKRLEQQAA